MNKSGLAEAVNAKLGGTKKMADDAVETVFDTIIQSLSQKKKEKRLGEKRI